MRWKDLKIQCKKDLNENLNYTITIGDCNKNNKRYGYSYLVKFNRLRKRKGRNESIPLKREHVSKSNWRVFHMKVIWYILLKSERKKRKKEKRKENGEGGGGGDGANQPCDSEADGGEPQQNHLSSELRYRYRRGRYATSFPIALWG